ncbi:MAG: sensor histidine kinase, partial [Gammaproteobacteria bacterium]
EDQRLRWQARQLTVSVHGRCPALPLDGPKIASALGNLLSNAIRFSPVGGRIDIALSHADGRVVLDIRDEGAGIAPEDRDRVFEPVYRGSRQPIDAPKGSGIGLSIVQEYIQAHGGRMTLQPSERGAHFRIELPHAA